MRIISHRGYWKTSLEKNLPVAFERSFHLGYGTETDIRDCKGEIVISHDMPKGCEITADAFFALACQYDLPIAINVKADGLAPTLKVLLGKYRIKDYFVFDMSIPDTLQYIKAGIPVYARLSEYESTPACYDNIAGLWLDAFENIWYTPELIKRYLLEKKFVCLVSPELHQRDSHVLWNMMKNSELHFYKNLMLCTDFPEIAENFFYGEQQDNLAKTENSVFL